MNLKMASESPDVVVVAPVVENGGAESSNGKDEQLESELSKKLEIAEDGKEDNDEDEGSKAETSTKKKKKKKNKSKTWQIDKNLDVQKDLVWIDQEQQRHYILGTPSTVCSCQDSSLLPLSHFAKSMFSCSVRNLMAPWNPALSTPEALKGLQVRLKKWNKEVFGDIHVRKEKLVAEIKEVQDLLDVLQSDELLAKEEQLLKSFDTVLEQEETLWYQKSREKFIELGDRNTTFFHTSTIIRRRRNRVEALKDGDNRWVTDKVELETMALDYYKRLYSLVDVSVVREMLPTGGFPQMTSAEKNELIKPFTPEEVVCAVKGMGRFKAPGPDGFQPVFYQQCWDIVGESVTRFVLEFFASGNLPATTNDALLVLIAKVAKPERITQFRPVSLCNVLFKIITKMMVNRLKSVISKLIGPAQSSFIPGRLSIDNIVLVQEVVHSMRRKKGRKGWMLLKLDLEKAYDRIRWDFLQETLEAAGLSEGWTSRIMAGVKDPSMSILWNGERTDSFIPARGLRQGDPLSPYLFVLCLERLCHLIEASVGRGDWKPIAISQRGPKLSHVCFADDLILFAEASVSQVRVIRRVLERFCEASGQKISLEKSKIFFSNNVSRDMERLISGESGIGCTRELGKYLGLPILQKRMNKETFGEVLERVSSRLAGWKSRSLSLAGRITLTKAVLSSIPVHSMSAILLPASTLGSLDKLSKNFLWGSTMEKKKQHLLSWKKVCRPKAEGGLGLRPAQDMNKALVAKVGWRLIQDKTSLWARVLRSKYKVGEVQDPSWLKPKSSWSSTWRSIGVGLREVVARGIGWVPGDGKIIRFWVDRWLLEKPLLEFVTGTLPDDEKAKTAEKYWMLGAGWDMVKLSHFLPLNVTRRLFSVVLHDFPGTRDELSWKGNPDGQFTVGSAYALLKPEMEDRPCMERFYKRLWRLVAPERVRVFIWLVSHQVIMTNAERVRRHVGESAVCPVCNGADESIIHVLRDCPAMSGLWRRLLPPRRHDSFFQKSLLEWVFDNLDPAKDNWPTMFSMAVWWAWKWRCRDVFGERKLCRDRLKFIKDLAEEVRRAHAGTLNSSPPHAQVERLIRWLPPNEGWVKITTDGASRGNPGLAAAGGAIRNADGEWLGGFAINIGSCSAPLAELWGAYYGLLIAWDKGFRRVELDLDSELVVGFLKSGMSNAHPLAFLVRLCHGFFTRDWLVRINHVYREANRLADGLANYAFLLPLGLHLFETCPEAVLLILLEDANGIAIPRAVRM
ncbi:Ribonuclease H domain [Arabidopsis thaliana x Arabidopsis arenosa]|uniref:Ribonuclease H domain n=1 Tax=Arabidopsis thaliana x Arabidopsis arenosa TaxID=1240361 RepID=A0A8T2A710_9BRAS|nr:Ribonuclease H domain [Arabidopsis thaliana x Arabidopsis arenosa]